MIHAGKTALPHPGACKPLFLLYKVRPAGGWVGWAGWGGGLGEVHGSTPPQRGPQDSSRPSPLSPFPPRPPLQNKVLIGKVQGVNAPELETLVVDNAPEATEEE
jgi:hypothetical protein